MVMKLFHIQMNIILSFGNHEYYNECKIKFAYFINEKIVIEV